VLPEVLLLLRYAKFALTPQEPRYLRSDASEIHHLNASEHTIEVAGVDIKSAYCPSRPQFNDRPVATALMFPL
jgi:hypothetical protein